MPNSSSQAREPIDDTGHQCCSEGYSDHNAYRGLLTQLFVLPVGIGLRVLLKCVISSRLVRGRRHDSPIAVDFRGLSARVPPEESAGLASPRATLPPRQCLTSRYADGESAPSLIRLTSHIRETRRDDHQDETWTCPELADTPDVGVSPRGGSPNGESGGGERGTPAAAAIVHAGVQGRGDRRRPVTVHRPLRSIHEPKR
jgi:hypothetical protein